MLTSTDYLQLAFPSLRFPTRGPLWRRRFLCWVPLAALAAVLSHSVVAEATREVRRILILNELGTPYPGILVINDGIQTSLRNSPYQLEFYSEYMDTILFPDPATQQEFRDFYLRKYRNRRPDLIITVGPSPLKFMRDVHQSAFPGIPIVFCLPNLTLPGAPALESDFTGVENDMTPAQTIDVALRLQPATKHVVVVSGVSDYDKQQQVEIGRQLSAFSDRVEVTYLTGLSMPEMLERLRHLPDHTVVLVATVGQDAAGNRFKSIDAGPLIAAASNAPIFSIFDMYLNHGEVGGYVSSISEQGKVAGAIALRILNGEKPQDIPTVKGVSTYMFDWRALKRWGFKESVLPPGSIVLNRQPGFWELYKQYVLVGILILLAQAIAILGLLWQRARRRVTEAKLRKSEEKFAKSFRQSPLGITISNANDSRYLEINETFERQTGWSRDELIGRTPFEIDLWVDPGERVAFMKELHRTGTVRDLEFRFRRKDGQIRTALGSSELIELNHERCALSVAADITERKAAEEAITALTGRLIDAQEDERKRIAREIHDDYSQRLALLAIELENLADENANSSAETSQRFHQIWNGISEIGADLHSLSHSLHSSTLDSLGLVAGTEAFCKEFAEQQHIHVDFADDNVPRDVPGDAALCLFRIVQEGLRNIKRHSGADRAEVRLEGSGEKLHLSVADRGRGFDVNNHSRGEGIGIRSMEERLRSMGGQFEVRSRPLGGTRIDAWLPLTVAHRRSA